jgi:hypothetical protein
MKSWFFWSISTALFIYLVIVSGLVIVERLLAVETTLFPLNATFSWQSRLKNPYIFAFWYFVPAATYLLLHINFLRKLWRK